MATPKLTRDQAEAHWRKTSSLMWTILFIWFLASFGVHFCRPTQPDRDFRLPAWLLHGRAGILIVFVILCYWSSTAQNRIDEEFGVAED